MTSLTYTPPPDLAQAVAEKLRVWESSDRVSRIWSGDAKVWTGTDEARWMGWLRVTGEQLAQEQCFEQFSAELVPGNAACRSGTTLGSATQVAVTEKKIERGAHAVHRLPEWRHD